VLRRWLCWISPQIGGRSCKKSLARECEFPGQGKSEVCGARVCARNASWWIGAEAPPVVRAAKVYSNVTG
jgi:hypothetical protein